MQIRFFFISVFSSVPRPSWLPESASKDELKEAKIYFLCGDDLLESFNVPGLWDPEDVSSEKTEFHRD